MTGAFVPHLDSTLKPVFSEYFPKSAICLGLVDVASLQFAGNAFEDDLDSTAFTFRMYLIRTRYSGKFVISLQVDCLPSMTHFEI